jgi:hypothetical protein
VFDPLVYFMLLPEHPTSQIDAFVKRKREGDYFGRAKIEQVERIFKLDDCPAPDTDILLLPSPPSYSGFGYSYDCVLKSSTPSLIRSSKTKWIHSLLRILSPGPRGDHTRRPYKQP